MRLMLVVPMSLMLPLSLNLHRRRFDVVLCVLACVHDVHVHRAVDCLPRAQPCFPFVAW